MDDEQRALAGDIPSNAHRESPLIPIPALNDWHLAAKKRTRTIEDLVGMTMVSACVGVSLRDAIVRMGNSRGHVDNLYAEKRYKMMFVKSRIELTWLFGELIPIWPNLKRTCKLANVPLFALESASAKLG